MSRSNWQTVRIAGYLAAFHLFAFSIGAYGGQIHSRQVVCAPLVKAAAFTYQQPVVGGHYMPAEALQQRAAAQFAMEASPDLADFQAYQQFRQFEAWKAGQNPAAGAAEPGYPPAQVAEPPMEPPPAPGGAGPLLPPAPGNQYPFAAKFPVLVAKCATCHGGSDPDAGLFLDGQVDLQGPHLAGRRDEIMDAIVNNRMPRKPGTDDCVPLADAEVGAIVAELWAK